VVGKQETSFAWAQEQAKERLRDVVTAAGKSTDDALSGKATWKAVTKQLRFAELQLNALRFTLLRVLQKKRPPPHSFRAREMAKMLAQWADELDDVEVEQKRRERLERSIGKLRVAMTRTSSRIQFEGSEDSYLRTVLIDTIENVAVLGNTNWKNFLPKDPEARWLTLADEVIRIYGEACDPALVPKMKRHRAELARAVESCTNRGGRGRFAQVHKSAAIPEACRALGFQMGEYSGARAASRRRQKKG
jgi:hypothetical protein